MEAESVIATLFSARELDSLHSEAPTPLYHQMYSLLKNRILDGSIPKGMPPGSTVGRPGSFRTTKT